MRAFARGIAVLFVFLALSGTLVGVAAGQEGTDPAYTQANTPTDTPTDSGNGSWAGNASGGGWGVPDVGVPEWFADPSILVEDTIRDLADGIGGFVDMFNRVVYGLPAPGDMGEAESWSNAEGGWWPGVWDTYKVLAAFGLWLTGVGALMAWNKPAVERRQSLKAALHAMLMILFGFWLTAGGYHLGNAFSLALAPSGSEFMQTPGNVARLGLGFALGAVLILFKTLVVLIGVFVLFAQWFLAHLIVAFWPLLWGLRAVPVDEIRTLGSVGIAAYPVLIVLKIFQAAIMRFLFEIPWDLGSPESTLPALVGTTVGLAVTNIWLPKLAVSKMVPASILVMGRSSAQTTEQGVERIRERASDVGQQVRERAPVGASKSAASSSTSSSSSGSASNRQTVGTLQKRSASYSRPGGKPGVETRSPVRSRRNERRNDAADDSDTL